MMKSRFLYGAVVGSLLLASTSATAMDLSCFKRLSLRSAFVGLTLAAVGFAWYGNDMRNRAAFDSWNKSVTSDRLELNFETLDSLRDADLRKRVFKIMARRWTYYAWMNRDYRNVTREYISRSPTLSEREKALNIRWEVLPETREAAQRALIESMNGTHNQDPAPYLEKFERDVRRVEIKAWKDLQRIEILMYEVLEDGYQNDKMPEDLLKEIERLEKSEDSIDSIP